MAVIGLVLAGAVGWGVVRRNGGGAAGEEPSGVSTELLSNEERVLELLRDHDGRIKQKEVAATLEWTATKNQPSRRDPP